MGSAPVVPPQVAGERTGALCARGVAACVGPFAEQRLNQSLGFPVCAGPVDPRVAALDFEACRGLLPGSSVVGLRIVGEHTLDDDPVRLIPGGGPLEEPTTAFGVLSGKQLGIGQTRVIVDGNVQVLPADPPVAVGPAGVRAERALAWLPKTTEFLRVDVQQLAWPLPFLPACAAGGNTLGPWQP